MEAALKNKKLVVKSQLHDEFFDFLVEKLQFLVVKSRLDDEKLQFLVVKSRLDDEKLQFLDEKSRLDDEKSRLDDVKL